VDSVNPSALAWTFAVVRQLVGVVLQLVDASGDGRSLHAECAGNVGYARALRVDAAEVFQDGAVLILCVECAVCLPLCGGDVAHRLVWISGSSSPALLCYIPAF